MAEDPVAGWELVVTAPMDQLMDVSGSPSFRAYQAADFGLGRGMPRRTENVTMKHDGQVALDRARNGDGV